MNILKRLVTQNWELCIDIIRKFIPEEEFNDYIGKSNDDLKTKLQSKPKNERHFYLNEYLGEDLFAEILHTTVQLEDYDYLEHYYIISGDDDLESVLGILPFDHEEYLNYLDLNEDDVRNLCEEHDLRLEEDMDLNRLLEKIHEDHGFEDMCTELTDWSSWEPKTYLKYLDVGQIFEYLIFDVYDETVHGVPAAFFEFEAHCVSHYDLDTNPYYLKSKIAYLDVYLDEIIKEKLEVTKKDTA